MTAHTPPDVAGRAPAPPATPLIQKVLALAGVVVAAIPAGITALMIWASLGRPLIFRQERAGLGGRTFTIVKFRTMHDTRDAEGRLLPDGERETALTRFIRRVRLDEIPQLLSILNGDIAFVGPRPLKPETIQAFGALGAVRCTVRPGLTGWAQVNGNTKLNDRQKLALDVWYVDHRSMALDAKILVKTVTTILFGEKLDTAAIAAAEAHLAARAGKAGGGR